MLRNCPQQFSSFNLSCNQSCFLQSFDNSPPLSLPHSLYTSIKSRNNWSPQFSTVVLFPAFRDGFDRRFLASARSCELSDIFTSMWRCQQWDESVANSSIYQCYACAESPSQYRVWRLCHQLHECELEIIQAHLQGWFYFRWSTVIMLWSRTLTVTLHS